MDSISSKTLFRMYSLYEMFPSESSKQLILEPLSCILKLGLLQYKPNGTKISVSQNSIQFHEPTLFQGLTRTLQGDSRHDLHNIGNPIVKCVEWYPLSDERFTAFYTKAIQGLTLLKDSYEDQSLINHTIHHYINILSGKDTSRIEDTSVTAELKQCWSSSELQLVETLVNTIESSEECKEIYVDILDQIVTRKEQVIHEKIHKLSTSY